MRVDVVAPFIDDQAYLIAYIDLARLDPGAIESWIKDSVKEARSDPAGTKELLQVVSDARGPAEAWLADFRKAGGRDLYVVASLTDLLRPPMLVVPLARGSDAESIKRFFDPPGPRLHAYGMGGIDESHAEQIEHAVVVAPADTLQRLHTMKPADRPDLMEALVYGGDAPVVVAVAPPPSTRRVVEEIMPKLPPELGGGDSSSLSRGLRWISFALQMPPSPSLGLTIHAQDAGSAKALSGVINSEIAALVHRLEQEGAPPGISKLLARLTPAPSPDHPEDLKLTLDKAAFQQVWVQQLPEEVRQARETSLRMVSMNNMKQLVLGCLQYADGHQGDWPNDLETAIKAVDAAAQVLINPIRPDSKPGYTYLNPGKAAKIKDYSSRMVIYETEPGPAGRNAGFADGHVQTVSEPDFQKYLKAAQAAGGDEK